MQVIINFVIYTITLLPLVISISILYKTTKYLHLSQAFTISSGAYIVYSLRIQWNLPFIVSIPIAILVCVVIMQLVFLFIYNPLSKRNIASWQMLIASLGVYLVLQNIISIIWGDRSLSFRIWEVKPGHAFMGGYITDIQLLTIGISIGLLGGALIFLKRTSIGQKITAISSNPELSGLFGISVINTLFWSFLLSTIMAIITGIMIAANYDMTPTMGFTWLLYSMIAMIISGLGKIRFLVFGTFLLGIIQHFTAYFTDSKWMNAIAFLILILFLYIRPYGLSGFQKRKAEI
jgi:branched-chain amino acid transport system permease protein